MEVENLILDEFSNSIINIRLLKTHLAGSQNDSCQLRTIAPFGKKGHREGLGKDAHSKIGGASALHLAAASALRVMHQRSINITIQLQVEKVELNVKMLINSQFGGWDVCVQRINKGGNNVKTNLHN